MTAPTITTFGRILQKEALLFNRGIAKGLSKGVHSSPVVGAGYDWRKGRGLPGNPNAYGPLTDGPDYSFIDGRPTPPGNNKIKRAEKQLKIAKKIIQLTSEVDFAVGYHKQRQDAEAARKADIINRKLKPKGHSEEGEGS